MDRRGDPNGAKGGGASNRIHSEKEGVKWALFAIPPQHHVEIAIYMVCKAKQSNRTMQSNSNVTPPLAGCVKESYESDTNAFGKRFTSSDDVGKTRAFHKQTNSTKPMSTFKTVVFY